MSRKPHIRIPSAEGALGMPDDLVERYALTEALDSRIVIPMSTYDVSITRSDRLDGKVWTELIVVQATDEAVALAEAQRRTRYPTREGERSVARSNRWAIGFPTVSVLRDGIEDRPTFPSRAKAADHARASGLASGRAPSLVDDRLTPVPPYVGLRSGVVVERHHDRRHLRMMHDSVRENPDLATEIVVGR